MCLCFHEDGPTCILRLKFSLFYFAFRQNLWGFERLKSKKGKHDHGAYYHPCFIREQPDLCVHMKRQKVKASQSSGTIRARAPIATEEQQSTEQVLHSSSGVGVLENSLESVIPNATLDHTASSRSAVVNWLLRYHDRSSSYMMNERPTFPIGSRMPEMNHVGPLLQSAHQIRERARAEHIPILAAALVLLTEDHRADRRSLRF